MNRIATLCCLCVSVLLLARFNLNSKMAVQASGDFPVHNVDTGLDYTSIREAINADETLDGHTIMVDAGTYYENIFVSKSLTLIGEDRETTIIDGGERGSVLYVIANNTVICGFTIQNSRMDWGYCGIYLNHSCNLFVSGNNLIHNYFGIALLWSPNCSVSGNNVDNNVEGIWLGGSANSSVSGNNITNTTQFGIYLGGSPNCSISGNTVFNAYFGVGLAGSTNCSVFGNNVICNDHGFLLKNSSRNTIHQNNVSDSWWYGVDLWWSSNNTFYHNNFVDNWIQIRDISGVRPDWPPSINTWDNGYPCGGNYWSDYNGTDYYSGPYQNVTGDDGIGDTPHVIDENNQDRYPLMNPYVRVRIVGDLNDDHKVDVKDLVLFIKAYGSHPAHPRWNLNADINCDGKVDIKDLVLLIKNYGKHTT